MSEVMSETATPQAILQQPGIVGTPQIKPVTKLQLFGSFYHLFTWTLLAIVLCSQLLGIWGIRSYDDEHKTYGQNPDLGPYEIEGENDEPYSDRAIVCVKSGSYYRPMMLNEALKSVQAEVIDTKGESINGYRVVQRNVIKAMDPDTYDHYVYECTQLSTTIKALHDSCDALGYNVTRDGLRIVPGLDEKKTVLLQDALPALILPYWDQALVGGTVFPGEDGNACTVRLFKKYKDPELEDYLILSVDREVREKKTAEWLRRPNGVWKNGWYEDSEGGKWHSQIVTDGHGETPLGLIGRTFDGAKNEEVSCGLNPKFCNGGSVTNTWGTKFSVVGEYIWADSVAISNGKRYGVFIYESMSTRTVTAEYDLETFLSNISMGLILLRWIVCMVALLHGYKEGLSNWHNTGIGCLSCARSFNMIPIMMAPRLKVLLAALWTCGGDFEGSQQALSESWFVIYPSLAAFLLFYFSILNIVAKIFFRRFSDKFFTPTLLFFFLLHRFRIELGESNWFEFDGRMPTLILGAEFDTLSVSSFFFSDASLRMNGNIKSFVVIKLVILGLNILPLLFSESMTTKGRKYTSFAPCDVERSLALRASNVGGLGRSNIYEADELPSEVDILESQGYDYNKPRAIQTWTEIWAKRNTGEHDNSQFDYLHQTTAYSVALNSYEIVRLGYLVFGGKYMISFDDWYIISSLAPLRFVDKLWNHRVTVFQVIKKDDGIYLSPSAQLCRVDDPRLLAIPFYDVSMCNFK